MLGGVQGAESLFLWRAIGGAVLTLVPAVAYSLKVRPACTAATTAACGLYFCRLRLRVVFNLGSVLTLLA